MQFPLFNYSHPIEFHIIGCGATGSRLCDLLADSLYVQEELLDFVHFSMVIWDGDTINEHNVGKQTFYRNQVGLNKASAKATELSRKYETSKILGMPTFFDVSKLKCKDELHVSLINGSKRVTRCYITAVDDAHFRFDFRDKIQKCNQDTMFWIDIGNAKDKGQIMLGNADYLPYLGVTLDDVEIVPQRESCSAEQSLSQQSMYINTHMALLASEQINEIIMTRQWNNQKVIYNQNIHKAIIVPL